MIILNLMLVAHFKNVWSVKGVKCSKKKITWSNSYLTVSAVSRMSEKRASQKSEINVFSPKQVVFVSFI